MPSINLKLLPKQKEFIYSREPTLFVAGFGSGKSFAGVAKVLAKKLEYPQHKVAYYLPTYPLIRDIAFDKFTELLTNLSIPYKLNKSDKEINLGMYGTIIFRSMSDPETIVGYEVAYSLIDEADILKKSKMELAYKKILGRNRSVENAQVDMVSTPEGFKFLYDQAKSGKFKVITSKTTDNKFIPQTYIADLMDKYTPTLLKAYMNGEFVNLTSGTVYEYFDRRKHSSNETIRDGERLYIGQDFNIGGSCSAVAVIRGDEIHVVDEIESHDTFDIVENVKAKYPNNIIEMMPDASGANESTNASSSDIEILMEAGFEVTAPRQNGKVKNRVNTVNLLFHKKKLFINVKICVNITESLEQQAYDNNGKPEKHGGAATVDDWNDSLGYMVVRVYEYMQQSMVNLRMKVG